MLSSTVHYAVVTGNKQLEPVWTYIFGPVSDGPRMKIFRNAWTLADHFTYRNSLFIRSQVLHWCPILLNSAISLYEVNVQMNLVRFSAFMTRSNIC